MPTKDLLRDSLVSLIQKSATPMEATAFAAKLQHNTLWTLIDRVDKLNKVIGQFSKTSTFWTKGLVWLTVVLIALTAVLVRFTWVLASK